MKTPGALFTASQIQTGGSKVTAAQEIDYEFGLPKIRQLLTPREVADYLRVDIDHVYRLVEEGELIAENHALRPKGKTPKGREKQRYLRIIRDSVIAYRKGRRYSP